MKEEIIEFAKVQIKITKEANTRRGVTKQSLERERRTTKALLRAFGVSDRASLEKYTNEIIAALE